MGLKLRVTIGCQHEIIEELRIKESRVGLTGPSTIAGVFGIAGNYVELVFTRAVGSYGHIIQALPNE